MAKSIRSSTKKRNHAKLRSTVFGPAVDARTERLSAKLQEIAARPLKTEIAQEGSEDSAKTGEGEMAGDESDSKLFLYSDLQYDADTMLSTESEI